MPHSLAHLDKIAYYNFVTHWRKQCAPSGRSEGGERPYFPETFAVARAVPDGRDRYLRDFMVQRNRKQGRVAMHIVNVFINERRSAKDMVVAATAARQTDATARIKQRYPRVPLKGAMHAALVDIELKMSMKAPFFQALLQRYKHVVSTVIPRIPRCSMLIPHKELERAVTQALKHAKLVRMCELTATDIPPGIDF